MRLDTNKIEAEFDSLLSNKKVNPSGLEKALSEVTHKKIHVNIVPEKKDTGIFIMSITPDKSTVQKISESLYSGKTTLESIQELWRKCDDWRLDIDERVLSMLTPKELTAVTLHEIGHITQSDAIPKRIQNVIQFSVVTSMSKTSPVLQDKFFSKILALPITAACQFRINPNKAELRKEMKADKLATFNGYGNELVSAMTKLEQNLRGVKEDDVDGALKYSMNILNSISERKDAITKTHFLNMRKYLPNTAVLESAEDIYNAWFMGNEPESPRYSYISESVNKYVTDFMEFGSKKLEPIEQNQIDYIRLKIEDMNTINDKMMIISYINSKLNLITYYKEILSNPKTAKKYRVPHSISSLDQLEKELVMLKNIAFKTKIDKYEPGVRVIYPDGYEG